MASSGPRVATYDDILALPPNLTGQLLFGVLHVHPRPAPRHVKAATTLGGELEPPFNRGRGGPGGWILLAEPELHLGEHVLVAEYGVSSPNSISARCGRARR